MMTQVLDFLSTKARGFILTLMGTGGGLAPQIEEKIKDLPLTPDLHPLQKIVLLLTAIVTVMTIISYGYKFVKWSLQIFKRIS